MKQTADPNFLIAFRKYLHQVNIFRVQVACILGSILVPLFSVLDYFLVPDYFRMFFEIRLVCAAATLSFYPDLYLADIRHELRTPLSMIRGEAEVTLRGKEKPVDEYKKMLQYIVLLTEPLNTHARRIPHSLLRG